MTEEQGRTSSPVRIEMATSEIDGGNCMAWADPAQVLALVALSHPEDTFMRMVEPRLGGLDAPSQPGEEEYVTEEGGGDDPAAASELPAVVRTLADRLQAIHRRLYLDNRSLHRDLRSVEITCAMADEDRVYLIKGGTAWLCLLREGRAYAAEANAPRIEASRPALGAKENLRLEVTSVPVQPGDTIILLTAALDVPVDTGALAHLFSQTPDLKRACDGLVNLLGLQSQGASAVALRFTPIASHPENFQRENPLTGLSSEWIGGPPDAQDAPIEALLERAFPGAAFSAAGQTGTPMLPVFQEPVGGEVPSLIADHGEAVAVPAAAHDRGTGRAARRPGPARERHERRPFLRGRRPGVWIPILAAFLLVSVLAIALPRLRGGSGGSGMGSLFHSGTMAEGKGEVVIEPDPPARQVLLDGQPAGEETPVRLAGVAAGKHRLGLDLGPCGIWETDLRVEANAVTRIAPRLKGSIDVSAADPSTGGQVWTEGRGKIPVPARLDSLPVGWNRLFYEDARIPMWDRQVLVRAGQRANVVVPNQFSSDQGLIKVESLTYRERQGMVDSQGDTVFVDGVRMGETPWQATLNPGLHSVRVTSAGDGSSYCEVLDVRAGAARNVSALLGQGPRPIFHHVSPGRVLIRGPVLLSVEIEGVEPGPELHPTLHLPELPPGSREIPLTLVSESQGTYIGAINPDALSAGQPVSYYFSVVGRHGEVVCSDLFKFTAGNRMDASEGAAEPQTPTPKESTTAPAGAAP